MKISLKNSLLGILAAGAFTTGALKLHRMNSDPKFQRHYSVSANGRVLNVPDYEFNKDNCAMGARLIARDIFGMKYAECAAWDRLKKDKILAQVNSFEELEQLAESGHLKEGMIIGIFNPDSRRKEKYTAGFTHNAVYLGKSEENGHLFAHNLEDPLFIENTEQLRNRKYEPRYIFAPKEQR